MTQNGVLELYNWLTMAWPQVVRPGASEQWKAGKMKLLYQTYHDYQDEDVLAAFQHWTENNDKYPTVKNILNEVKWAAAARATYNRENEQLWYMDYITSDGTEWTYGSFRRSEFVNHPKNPDHIQPEEWERNYRKVRNQILNRLYEERTGHTIQQGKEWIEATKKRIKQMQQAAQEDEQRIYREGVDEIPVRKL